MIVKTSSLKLFRGVFMNYDDLYKLYTSSIRLSSSENMDWFDDYIEDVFGKESYYVSGSSSHCPVRP
jgi:hypothetical protein